MNKLHQCVQKILPAKHFFHMEIKGHNSDYNNSKDISWKPFSYAIKGHDSDNNWRILSLVELDLHAIVRDLRDVQGVRDVWTRVMRYAPHPHKSSGGINKL